MKLDFRAVPKEEAERVELFLRERLQPDADEPFVQPAQVRWKYFEPRPDWTGSRSYIFEGPQSNIAAHVCAWPFTLQTPDARLLAGIHPIDWVADASTPGAGALLLRQIRSLKEISCCIGGTDIAQKVIASTGYKPAVTMRFFVRPLRPFKQMLTRPRRDIKTPARYARNLLQVLGSRPSINPEWSSERIEADRLPDAVLPNPQQAAAVPVRTAGLFQYMSGCPTARFELYVVKQGSEPRGYFLLSFVPGQARLADAWIFPGTQDNWMILAKLAIRAAHDSGSSAEMIAWASLPAAAEAFAASGFRQYFSLPVMLFDSRKHLEGIRDIHLQMIDTDLSFLHSNRIEYES